MLDRKSSGASGDDNVHINSYQLTHYRRASCLKGGMGAMPDQSAGENK